MKKSTVAPLCLIFLAVTAHAQSPSNASVPATVDNFARAETDNYLATNSRKQGSAGSVIVASRPQSITRRSFGSTETRFIPLVCSISRRGRVTIALPDAGKRFMSLEVINQDHYVPLVAYDDKLHTFSEKSVGTRYMMIAIRTLIDANDPKDLEQAHQLQDAIKVTQRESGELQLPNWDQASLKEIREALLSGQAH